jgi:hypothetical protein
VWHLDEEMVKASNAVGMRNYRRLLMVIEGGFGEEK